MNMTVVCVRSARRMAIRNASSARRALLLLGILLLVSALAGCGRIQAVGRSNLPGIKVTVSVQPSPADAKQPGTVAVTLAEQDGRPIDGARVEVEGDMTHAGMTPVIVSATGSGGGRYMAPLAWTMAGDWVVTATARLPDGRTASRQMPVRVE